MDKTEYIFDENAVDKVVLFFNKCLIHFKGKWAGQPFTLQEWQYEVVRDLFGWKKPDGTRRYRNAYIEIPRCSGKSTFAAGILLYMLVADNEAAGESYACATTSLQAGIIFNTAKAFINNSPLLKKRIQCYQNSLFVQSTNSKAEKISSDGRTKDGMRSHCIVWDELHEATDNDLWDKLNTSMGGRSQPLLFAITTAGIYNPNSICYKQHKYCKDIQDGIIEDDTFYGKIYSADKEDDWQNEDTWRKAQPALDELQLLDYYKQEAIKAKNQISYQNTFRRYYLNQWVEQVTRWLPMDKWENDSTFDPEMLKGEKCFAGLDLSSTRDLSSLILLFQVEDTYYVLPFYWIPELTAVDRTKQDGVMYSQWVSEGWIEATEGNVVDYDVIRQKINELNEVYQIKEIAIDRWNSTQLQTQLMGDGLTVIPFGQGFASMSAPTKALEALVYGGKIRHNNNPVLRWNVSNVAISHDPAGNIKPDRAKSTEKIDGVISLVMSLGRAILEPEIDTAKSVYEERGLITL